LANSDKVIFSEQDGRPTKHDRHPTKQDQHRPTDML